jgi:hypothetical protein
VVGRSAQPPRAHGPAQPEDQQNDQHQAEQSATVMWTAPTGASSVVVAPASAEEKDQHDIRRISMTSPSETSDEDVSRLHV